MMKELWIKYRNFWKTLKTKTFIKPVSYTTGHSLQEGLWYLLNTKHIILTILKQAITFACWLNVFWWSTWTLQGNCTTSPALELELHKLLTWSGKEISETVLHWGSSTTAQYDLEGESGSLEVCLKSPFRIRENLIIHCRFCDCNYKTESFLFCKAGKN